VKLAPVPKRNPEPWEAKSLRTDAIRARRTGGQPSQLETERSRIGAHQPIDFGRIAEGWFDRWPAGKMTGLAAKLCPSTIRENRRTEPTWVLDNSRKL
jgi:hypothetical protein